MGQGEGGSSLLGAFLGCLAGILVALGRRWASCSLRGGFVGWLVPVPESRKWQAGGGPRGDAEHPWGWLMALECAGGRSGHG